MTHLRPNAQILQRPRVLETLSEAVSSYPLTVLTAPSGYGKTMAIRELADNHSRRVYYMAMPQGRHSARQEWDIMFGQMVEQGCGLAQTLLQMGPPSDVVDQNYIIEETKKAVATEPCLLICDDYHCAQSPELNSLIEAVAREAVPNMHLLLVSRSRPALPLEELRLKGMAAVLGQELLAFTEEETRQLFRLYGVAEDNAAGQAWSFSEGWAAALWLSLQSYKAHGIIEPVSNLESLISETIFSGYTEEEQKLLLQLSLLDGFTQKQAAMISMDETAPHRLRSLHDRNAFLTYTPATCSYRLHSIFRAYLSHRLNENALPVSQSIDKAELFRRAGECLIESKDYLRALQFFEQAGRDGDLLRILQLFEQALDSDFIRLAPDYISSLAQSLPWSIRAQCPFGYLSFVYCYLFHINLEKGLRLLREAEAYFAHDESMTADLRRQVQGEIEVIYGLSRYRDFPALCAHYKKAHELLRGPSRCIKKQQSTWFYSFISMRFNLFTPGDFGAINSLLKEYESSFDTLVGHLGSGAMDLLHAEHALETGDLHRVEPFLMKSALQSSGIEQLHILLGQTYQQSRLLIAAGEAEKGWEVMTGIRQRIVDGNSLFMLKSFEISLAMIACILNRPQDIPQWLLDTRASSFDPCHVGMDVTLYPRCRALLQTKNWPELEILAEKALKCLSSPQDYCLFHRIHLNILLSILAMHKLQTALSMDYLSNAVELARPDNLVTIIAEYGMHLLPLLRQLQSSQPGDSFINLLCKLSLKYSKLYSSPDRRLSAKEQYILEKASSGVSNRVISEQLGIAETTVGNILSRVNKKLGRKGRSGPRKKYSEKAS